MTERAKLCSCAAALAPITVAVALLVACTGRQVTGSVVPSYEPVSGRLVQLAADQDGNGRIDQWTYLDGARPIRGEKDADQDGRIDRWEYFGPQSELSMIGTSSGEDGIEDRWTWVTPIDGEGRVDVSTLRDRRVDRHEYFVNDALVRVESDTNGDGRIDRWDRYEGAVLREVQFDTSFAAARANRRLLYDPQGRYLATEADDDRDGRFERVAPGAASLGGVKE